LVAGFCRNFSQDSWHLKKKKTVLLGKAND